MNHLPRPIYLHYSKLPSMPILGGFCYALQTFLYKKDVLSFFFLSRRKNQQQQKFLRALSQRAAIAIVRTHKLSDVLKKLPFEVVLDLEKLNIHKMDKENLYSLMWSLVRASSVTEKTKAALKNLLWDGFPSKKIIIIPYNDSFEVVCDYIFQTAKVLANSGNIVYLVTLANPASIAKVLFGKKEGPNARSKFFEENKIFVINPLTLFPIRLQRIKVIEKINRLFELFYTNYFIKSTKADFLWCFDPADIDLVKKVGKGTKTIYDCVDYFSSLNSNVDEQIKGKERKLIKAVDYFFVNSNALAATKGKIRKPHAVVAQGFDAKSFARKETLTSQEKKEIFYVRKLFSQIPRPRVGFVGALTYRFDFKLMFSLIQKMPKVSFVFTDALLPIPDDDRLIGTQILLDKIRSAPNCFFIPKTFYRSVIKEILSNFDIGIIPYDIRFDFNRFCYPMKLFEYFYMKLPVLSTPIEELKKFPKYVKIGEDAEEWKQNIKTLLSKPWSKNYSEEQKRLAIGNSWEVKIKKIIEKIS